MPKKILVIEDRRENIVFIANNILKPLGHKVITAMDGKTGLNKAQTESPDLIITDLKLPKMGGLEVLEELNRLGCNIPAIVMTFHGTEGTAVRALKLGAIDYLIKPFTIEEMHEALEKGFNSSAGQSLGSTLEEQENIERLEQQLVQVRTKGENRIKELEQQLMQARSYLVERDKRIKELKEHAEATSISTIEAAELAQRAAEWEDDNARLSQKLALATERQLMAEGRTNALKEAMISQKEQMDKYLHELTILANALQSLPDRMSSMSNDIEHQIERLGVLMPADDDAEGFINTDKKWVG